MCPRHEVTTHPTKSKDPKYFSFKHKQAGYLYEIGIAIHEQKCVWANGPLPAGVTNDKGHFDRKLKAKIPPGKRAVGDSGYAGNPDKITIKRPEDSPAVRKFKRRSLARHENFNEQLKEFDCLSNTFRHHGDSKHDGDEKHKMAFMAVLVICQTQLELEMPLIDV